MRLCTTAEELAGSDSVDAMRWQELFADLEGQARSLEQADQRSEVAERTRAEVGQISLINRLRAHVSRPVTLMVVGAGDITGQLRRVGADWLLVAAPDEVIVPLSAVSAAADLPPAAVSPEGVGVVASRLGLGSVLRAVARDRGSVALHLRDSVVVVGTPDRVGFDFLDLAVHEPGEVPRPSGVRTRLTVRFDAIAAVRRHHTGWE